MLIQIREHASFILQTCTLAVRNASASQIPHTLSQNQDVQVELICDNKEKPGYAQHTFYSGYSYGN